MIQTTSVTAQDGTAGNAAITLGYILDSGRLSITPTGSPYWSIANAQFDVTISNGGEQQSTVSSARGMDLVRETSYEDAHGRGKQYRFEARGSGEIKLTCLVKVPDSRPFLLLRLLARNVGSQPVRLHDLTLLRALPSTGGGVRLADGRLPLDFFQVGWHGWAFTGLRHANQRAVSTRVGRWTRSIQFNTALPSSTRPGEFWGD